METGASTSFQNELTCVVNKVSHEYMEHAEPESVPDAEVSGWEIVNVNSPEILSYEYPVSPVVNLENKVYIIPPLLDDALETISMSGDQDTDAYHNSQSLSTIHSTLWPSTDDSQVQALDMVINEKLQSKEIINGDGSHLLFEGGRKDALPSDILTSVPVIGCNPSLDSDSCLAPNTYLVFPADDLPLAELKQPLLSACANAPRNCSAAMHHSDATDNLTASAESEDYHHLEPHHPPERLLSTRKAISPTSQERLCKAMNSVELNDDKHSECRGKLLFGNQMEIKVFRAEVSNEMKRAGIASSTKQVLGKSKFDKKGFNPNTKLKGPHLSSTAPTLGTGCTPTQNLTRSAIAFSRRQIHDIESLASKLTAELSSMKELMKEMVHSDIFPASSLKHNIAKVTMAIKNASKAEENSRRWLSIMNRDCSRFCKIMTLTEENSTAPGNVVPKERRKITFADEAGGNLCHVKFFKNDIASPLEPIDIEA